MIRFLDSGTINMVTQTGSSIHHALMFLDDFEAVDPDLELVSVRLVRPSRCVCSVVVARCPSVPSSVVRPSVVRRSSVRCRPLFVRPSVGVLCLSSVCL